MENEHKYLTQDEVIKIIKEILCIDNGKIFEYRAVVTGFCNSDYINVTRYCIKYRHDLLFLKFNDKQVEVDIKSNNLSRQVNLRFERSYECTRENIDLIKFILDK